MDLEWNGRGGHGVPALQQEELIEKSCVRIKLSLRHVAFADWVHCDVVKVLLEIEVVADYMIEESRLPQPLL